VDEWYFTDLLLPRAASANLLKQKLLATEIGAGSQVKVQTFSSPTDAYAIAQSRAAENDRIVVFGSFLTVASVMQARKNSNS
jgi:dihydrofolate synthase/folylpolyglutamate synthase